MIQELDRAVQFGRQLLLTQDLDPVYTMVYRSNIPQEAKARFCLAYWCFYNVGIAGEVARTGFSPEFSGELAALIPEARWGGVYAQTPGPRIETKAEVRLVAAGADLVGMTIASEATLAGELGLEVAALCTVDNYANGLSEETLTYEHILTCAEENKDRTSALVERIIGGLA